MLNQKDNDFDDLFRRASDKYPLRTDSADWDRMSAALDDPSTAILETQDTEKRKKRRFIWFFLLLPLGGAGYYIFHHTGAGHSHAVATESVVKAPASGAGVSGSGAGGASGASADGENGAGAGVAGTDGSGAGGNGAGGNGSGAGSTGAGASDADAKGTGASGSGAGTKGEGAGGVDASGAGKGAGGSVKAGGNPGVSAAVPAATGGSDIVSRGKGGARKSGAGTGANGSVKTGGNEGVLAPVAGKNIIENRHGKNGVGGIKDAAPGGVVGGAASGMVGASKDGAGASKDGGGVGTADGMAGEVGGRVANYPVNRAPISKDYHLTVNVVAPVVAKDSSKVKPKASSKQKSSFLYAGLMAAPDLSTVKFQSMKGVGTTYSLLLGYQFNKRWAVETGVSLDRKRYYTSGEYFDTKNVHLPTWGNYTLTDVDGTCYMWEIPVNVRYNFSQTEKTKWFATAGLSTYFMTREKYDYSGVWNGSPSDSNWDIKKPSQYWFSIINLSAGYEHRLGGIGNLRIEPYLRVPLSGLGTGKLNILSTGINIGITRKLW